jgi:flavoprotein
MAITLPSNTGKMAMRVADALLTNGIRVRITPVVVVPAGAQSRGVVTRWRPDFKLGLMDAYA